MTSASHSSSSAGMGQADWLSALVVIAVWGVNFVVMKWGLATLSPLVLCTLRFLAASLPFLLFVKPPRNVGWTLMAACTLRGRLSMAYRRRWPPRQDSVS